MSAPTGKELEQLRADAQAMYRDLRARKPMLDDDSIDVILRNSRSHYAWKNTPVPKATLETLYEITAAGPTSMNCCPSRYIFVTSDEGKQRLAKIFGNTCRFYFLTKIVDRFSKVNPILSRAQHFVIQRYKVATL